LPTIEVYIFATNDNPLSLLSKSVVAISFPKSMKLTFVGTKAKSPFFVEKFNFSNINSCLFE